MPWYIIISIAIVIAIVGVWVLARGRAEQRHDGRRTKLTACGVWTVYLLHTGATIAAAVWIEFGSWLTPRPLGWVIGAVLIVFGIALCAWAMASFRSLSRISGTATDELVTGGPYRFSRNPQNTGWGLMLIGIAVAGHSTVALLLAAAFWIVFAAYVRQEERFLLDSFGERYIEYCLITPRFFGQPRRQRGEK